MEIHGTPYCDYGYEINLKDGSSLILSNLIFYGMYGRYHPIYDQKFIVKGISNSNSSVNFCNLCLPYNVNLKDVADADISNCQADSLRCNSFKCIKVAGLECYHDFEVFNNGISGNINISDVSVATFEANNTNSVNFNDLRASRVFLKWNKDINGSDSKIFTIYLTDNESCILYNNVTSCYGVKCESVGSEIKIDRCTFPSRPYVDYYQFEGSEFDLSRYNKKSKPAENNPDYTFTKGLAILSRTS